MKQVWRDTTTYPEGERGKMEPTSWTFGRVANLAVVLTRDGDFWRMDVQAIGVCVGIGTNDADEAKRRALNHLDEQLEGLRSYYEMIGALEPKSKQPEHGMRVG
jgi:hypothetical protein